jgi:hypothetical protein
MSGITGDKGQNRGNVPKWVFFDRIYKNKK